MTRKYRLLSGAIAAITAFSVLIVSARPAHSTAGSTVVTKQSGGSAYSLCQAELRRRMGGAQSIVSITVLESIPSATTIRLVGEGTYSRGDGSRSQPFNFNCIVNLDQSRISSLSYTFTSNSVRRITLP